MTQRIPDIFSMLDWSLALIMGNILPPRDPNEDDDDEDEDSGTGPDDPQGIVARQTSTAMPYPLASHARPERRLWLRRGYRPTRRCAGRLSQFGSRGSTKPAARLRFQNS
jgi:hypothetical protein